MLRAMLNTRVLLLAIVLVLAGCATPAGIEQMTVHAPAMRANDSALKNSVAVKEVTGGRETNPMAASQVSSSAFHRALENSLKNAGLGNPLLSSSRYHLTADIVKVDQPFLGLDMTVSATVRYSLIEAASRKEIYTKVIPSSYTAKFSDAFAGTERLRLANEGAAKTNIQTLVDELLALTPSQ